MFYDIVPNKEDRSCTFHYNQENEIEASSIIDALPLFVESQFKVKAKTFFRSSHIAQAKNGDYDHTKRLFVSKAQKEKNCFITNLEAVAKATVPKYLSTDHKML